MKELDRLRRNVTMLSECHPWFRDRMARVIAALEKQGRRPRIQCAYRSLAQQALEVAEGNSSVTYGFHNVTGIAGRAESFAVDLLDDDDPLDGDSREPGSVYCLMLAAAAETEGLSTLIRWGLTAEQRSAVDNAIRLRDYHARVKVGKDPTHVQPGPGTEITAERLRGGWRPAISGAADTMPKVMPEAGTAPVSEPTPPSSELQAAIDLTAGLPPMPSWHGFEAEWSQIEQDLSRMATDGLSRLPLSTQDRVRRYPAAVLEAARARVIANAPAGSTWTEALGIWRRTYRQDPAVMREVVEAITEWWGMKR